MSLLNRIGQSTHDLHNESILFSDAIGVSTLVCLLNNGNNGGTESTSALLGPFWRLGAPETENGGFHRPLDEARRLPGAHGRPGGGPAA